MVMDRPFILRPWIVLLLFLLVARGPHRSADAMAVDPVASTKLHMQKECFSLRNGETVKEPASLTCPCRQRRSMFGALAACLVATSSARPSHAVQPRNEALCQTGLFENFLEYRCTPVGDIQDEGVAKALLSQEEATTDSLLLKLGSGGSDEMTTNAYSLKEKASDDTNRLSSTMELPNANAERR